MAQTCACHRRKNSVATRRQIVRREPSPEARLAPVVSRNWNALAAHRILPRPASPAKLRLRILIGVMRSGI